MSGNRELALIIFAVTLTATFVAAVLARKQSVLDHGDGLAGRRLNRWLVGLSAGTTANSGFIVTAAVGLGYTYGLQWVLLPLAWLLGDMIFWYFFPARINAFGHESRVTTLTELLRYQLKGPFASAIGILSAAVILVCLAGYTSAQWLAGQKFLVGAFGLPDVVALGVFGLLIVSYSSIGGFRGSVYTDTLQAFVRIIGTVVAIGAVTWFALLDRASFAQNIAAAGSDFLTAFPGGTLLTACGFIFGFAAAALGFGLGQPQIISRYLAGSSPEETRSAWWIYIAFVQFTWVTMTVFGMMLRGVMPEISDPETGLSVFFQQNLGAIATGIIVADVFATIASTSNGLLIAMAQAANHDLLARLFGERLVVGRLGITTVVIGALTMSLSLIIHGTVLTLALSSVSMMGAGLAGPVLIKVLRWRHSAMSLFYAICAGLAAAVAWKYCGLGAVFNESGVGIAAGLLANRLALCRNAAVLELARCRDASEPLH